MEQDEGNATGKRGRDDDECVEAVENPDRKKQKKNPFVDDMAQVNRASDEEDDGEDDPDWLVDDAEPGAAIDTLRNREPEVDSSEDEVEEREYEDEEEEVEKDDPCGIEDEANAVTRAIRAVGTEIASSPNEKLWEVGCKVGKERDVVLRIMRRVVNPKVSLGRARCAFSVPSSHGRIYVEASKEDDVLATVRGVTGVYASRLRLVPEKIFRALLDVPPPPSLVPGTWVRLLSPSKVPRKYHGDVGMVTDVTRKEDEAEERYIVVCVPRENRMQRPQPLTAGQISQCQGKGREVASFRYDGAPEISHFYHHKGQTYSNDGYLFLGGIGRRDMEPVKPPRDVLHSFKTSLATAWAVRQAISASYWEHATYKMGDTVLINDSGVGVRLGVVRSHDHITNVCTVLVKDLALELEFPTSVLRLGFTIGDTVSVDVGEHDGLWGWIVGKLPHRVEIFVTARRDIIIEEEANLSFYEPPRSLVDLRARGYDEDLKEKLKWKDLDERERALPGSEPFQLRPSMPRVIDDLREGIRVEQCSFHPDIENGQIMAESRRRLRMEREAGERAERTRMRANPNELYHGKMVRVTGAHMYKGHLGTIIDTDLKGVAALDLHTFGSKPVKVPLNHLHISRKDGSLARALLDLNPKKARQNDKGSAPREESPVGGMTPMHEPSFDDSPSWHPGEDEVGNDFIPPPFPEDVHPLCGLRWLLDMRAKSLRVLVRQVSSAGSFPWSTRQQVIQDIRPDGQEVLIEYQGKARWVKVQDVRTLRPRTREGPTGPLPLVTCKDPDNRHFGTVWAVHRKQGLKIILHRLGQTRVTKKNPEVKEYASDWVEVLR